MARPGWGDGVLEDTVFVLTDVVSARATGDGLLVLACGVALTWDLAGAGEGLAGETLGADLAVTAGLGALSLLWTATADLAAALAGAFLGVVTTCLLAM